MTKLKMALGALLTAALMTTAVYAAGLWPTLPTVGSAGGCSGYSAYPTTPTVPGVTPTPNNCNSPIPPGPSTLTGTEVVPADTGLSQGQAPQSVLIPVTLLGGGATQYSTPLTGTSITIAPQTKQVIVNPAGTIAALTLVTPAAAAMIDGQQIGFCTTQVITALTTTAGTGVTVSNAPTAMLVPVATGAASCIKYQWVASAATLFRIQ